MKLNQFENSLFFITNHAPKFIKLLYEKFIIIENELYNQLKAAYNTNPYSVIEYINEISSKGTPFFKIFKYVMSKENQINIQLMLVDDINLRIENNFFDDAVQEKESEDDRLLNIDGGDIYAPVTKIKGFVSTFPYADWGNDIYQSNIPAICIEPFVNDRGASVLDSVDAVRKGEIFLDNYKIYNNTGVTSLFDCLESVIKIDINHVFTYFFHSLLGFYGSNINTICGIQDSAQKLEASWKYYFEMFNENLILGGDEAFNEFSRKTVENITNTVLGSSIFAYMTYAGKLLGAKEDLYGWFYSEFVKESVNEMEKGGLDFKSIDITAFSGNRNGYNDSGFPGNNTIINKSSLDKDELLKRNFPNATIEYNPNIVYRYLRLNYSNWSTCLNLIFGMSSSKQGANFFDSLNSSLINNGELNSHIGMARRILGEYISHNFATYNVYVFPDTDKKRLSIAGYFIQFVSNRIFDTELKRTIKDFLENTYNKSEDGGPVQFKSISDYFIHSQNAIASIKSVRILRDLLADLFMMYSYLVFLHGFYLLSDDILNEKENTTGKTKREVFLDIYYSLKKRINNFLSEPMYKAADIVIYSGREIKESDLTGGMFGEFNDAINKMYTPLVNYMAKTYGNVKREIENVRMVLGKITSPLTFSMTSNNGIIAPPSDAPSSYIDNMPWVCNKIITELYDVHPLSSIIELQNIYKYNNNFVSESDEGIYQYFPGNNPVLTRANSLFPKNKVAMELFNRTKLYEPKLFSSLESANEILSNEDAVLGSNANYSFLGSLGGAVTEQEESEDKFDKSNSISFESNENYNFLVEDARKMSIDNISIKWNKMFSKLVLGKEINV